MVFLIFVFQYLLFIPYATSYYFYYLLYRTRVAKKKIVFPRAGTLTPLQLTRPRQPVLDDRVSYANRFNVRSRQTDAYTSILLYYCRRSRSNFRRVKNYPTWCYNSIIYQRRLSVPIFNTNERIYFSFEGRDFRKNKKKNKYFSVPNIHIILTMAPGPIR